MLKGTPVVLRNAHTGKAVPATTSWDAHTLVLVVNPVNRLQAHTRYRVEVGLTVVDRGGNHLVPVHWGFVTGS